MRPDGGGGGGGGGRSNPYAGPNETKLAQALEARLEDISGAREAWKNGAQGLHTLELRLRQQERDIVTAYEGGTGELAAAGYAQVRAGLRTRIQEMDTMVTALQDAETGVQTAQTSYRSLPPVRPPATGNPTAGMPTKTFADRQAVQEKQDAADAQDAGHHDDYREAERQSAAALKDLDKSFATSASTMRPVAGMEEPAPVTNAGTTRSTAGQGAVPTSASGGSGHHTGTTHGAVLTATPTTGHTTEPTPTGTPTTTGPTYVPPGYQPEPATSGSLAGGTTQAPGSTVLGASGGSTGAGGTGGPVGSVSTGAAATAAGGMSAVAALGAARSGSPVLPGALRAGAPAVAPGSGTTGGRIGASSAAVQRGALGRSGMVPGQSSTTGRGTGGSGRSGGRSTGSAGGRSGGRSTGIAGQQHGTGRGGQQDRRRDDEPETSAEHYLVEDDSWLDDDDTGPATLG